MENKITGIEIIVKNLFTNFLLAFLFVFILLTVNQILLIPAYIREKELSSFIALLFYSLPSVIVMSMPFAACIGIIQGLIKLNIIEKLSQNNKNIIPIFVIGLILSILTFIVADFILPKSTERFSKLYRTVLLEDRNQVTEIESPREMSSGIILQRLNELRGDKMKLNIYLLELNKKYSIPFGVLIFILFALSLSIILQNHSKIALCISFISCALYWAILMFGQIYSIRNGKYGILVMWLPNIFFFCVSIILFCIKHKIKPPASMRAANVKEFNGA
jgi:lipopolysaccharide export LptBFGC system permease protein LptF